MPAATDTNCDTWGLVDFGLGDGQVKVRCTRVGPHQVHTCVVAIDDEPAEPGNVNPMVTCLTTSHPRNAHPLDFAGSRCIMPKTEAGAVVRRSSDRPNPEPADAGHAQRPDPIAVLLDELEAAVARARRAAGL